MSRLFFQTNGGILLSFLFLFSSNPQPKETLSINSNAQQSDKGTLSIDLRQAKKGEHNYPNSIIPSWKQSKNFPPIGCSPWFHILYIRGSSNRIVVAHRCPTNSMKNRPITHKRMLKLPIWLQPNMPNLPILLWLLRQRPGHLVVLVVIRHKSGQEMLWTWPPPGRVQKMCRHWRAGEQVVGGGIAPPTGTASSPTRGNPLHAFQVKSVLLQVTRHVFTSQPVHTHELHYSLRYCVLDTQVGHGVHKPLVELRGPHEPRPLQGSGWLVPARPTPAAQLRRVNEFGRGGVVRRRRRWG